jgi:hypothetical protein
MPAAVGHQIEAKSGKTYFQLAAEALVARTSNGDVQIFKEFADRIDGRSTQHVELAGSGGRPIEIDSQSEWQREWQASTPERRRQMGIEIDNKLIAAAQWILAERNRPEAEKRYRDRMQSKYLAFDRSVRKVSALIPYWLLARCDRASTARAEEMDRLHIRDTKHILNLSRFFVLASGRILWLTQVPTRPEDVLLPNPSNSACLGASLCSLEFLPSPRPFVSPCF